MDILTSIGTVYLEMTKRDVDTVLFSLENLLHDIENGTFVLSKQDKDEARRDIKRVQEMFLELRERFVENRGN